MNVRKHLLVCALLMLVVIGRCAKTSRDSFVLATTTSLESSGLLEVLEREFERDSGIRIQPVVVGSGLALRLATSGRADATITHDPRPNELSFWKAGRRSIDSSCRMNS